MLAVLRSVLALAHAGATPTPSVLEPPTAAAVEPTAPTPTAPTPTAPAELRTSKDGVVVRTEPSAKADLRGMTAPGASFRVLGTASGGSCSAGWAKVEANGFVCLDGTTKTDQKPEPWPVVLEYDPPDPSEYASYLQTGKYHERQPERIVPGIYARRYQRFSGQLYASVAAYERGDKPVDQLSRELGAKERFVTIVDTKKGPVLIRGDGKVARLDDVYLYPVSRLKGFDLEKHPLRPGRWPAFAIDYAGTQVYSAPDAASTPMGTVPYHAPLVIASTPADPTGHWWQVVEGETLGFVEDARGVRRPVPSPARPEGVGDDELWVDVELEQQVVMVWRGDDLAYFTLTSTGAAPHGTPTGNYHLIAKYAFKDMRSSPDADDWYAVEDVPWTMVFRPHYSLHTAYWHWGFGRTASHGCVNLAPRDAAWMFAHLAPTLPDGWLWIETLPADAPTPVRVRRGGSLPDDES